MEEKKLFDQLLTMYGYELYRLSLWVIFFIQVFTIMTIKSFSSSSTKENFNIESSDNRIGILDSDLNLHLRISEGSEVDTCSETSVNSQNEKIVPF